MRNIKRVLLMKEKCFYGRFFHVEGSFFAFFLKNDSFEGKKYKKSLDELGSL